MPASASTGIAGTGREGGTGKKGESQQNRDMIKGKGGGAGWFFVLLPFLLLPFFFFQGARRNPVFHPLAFTFTLFLTLHYFTLFFTVPCFALLCLFALSLLYHIHTYTHIHTHIHTYIYINIYVSGPKAGFATGPRDDNMCSHLTCIWCLG